MKALLIILLTLIIISSGLMALSFLALNDIGSDYVSSQFRETLPEWTACTGEWAVLQIDFLVRFILMIFLFIFTGRLLMKERRKNEKD